MILQVLQRHSLPTVDCMLPQLSQPKLAIHPEMLSQTHFARANLFCGVHGTGQQRTDLTVNLRGLQAAVNIAVQEIPFARGFLTRSLRTLEVRMHAHCANAMSLARFLSEEKGLPVGYSGLDNSPFHALAAEQFNEGLFGGMLSLDLGTYEKAMSVARSFKMVQLVPSLGCLTTTVSDTRTSHSSMSAEERRRSRIGDGVLRISVGLENIRDITADFEQALTAAG